MKKVLISSVSLACLVPAFALAEAPSWTYVEASYMTSDQDLDDDEELFEDVDLDGFEVAGSVGIGEWIFADVRYSEQNDDFDQDLFGIDFDLGIDLDRLSTGLGAILGVTDRTDIYGRLAYEKWDFGASFSALGESEEESVDEEGFSYAAGVRSVFWDTLELRGEIGEVDLGKDLGDDRYFTAGAYYILAELFTLGVSYTYWDDQDLDTVKATVRYQF